MELVIGFLLLWGLGIFFFGQKDKKESQKPPKSNLPDSVLDREFSRFRENLIEGNFAQEIDSSFILKGGEHLVFELPGIQFAEEQVKRTRGVGQGISVRVMKGVSYRIGAFSAAPERVVEPVDEGALTVTNQRISFRGTTRSIEFPLSKLSAIEALDTGISVSRQGKSKIEYFIGLQSLTASWFVKPDPGESFEAETVHYVFNGYECKQVIMELIKRGSE